MAGQAKPMMTKKPAIPSEHRQTKRDGMPRLSYIHLVAEYGEGRWSAKPSYLLLIDKRNNYYRFQISGLELQIDSPHEVFAIPYNTQNCSSPKDKSRKQQRNPKRKKGR